MSNNCIINKINAKQHLKLILLLLLWIFSCASSFAKETPKIIFALDIIRHGDRTPLIEIPNIPHQWEQGLGQLTAKGLQQDYELGIKLRQKYINHLHLLPEHYQENTLYVRSTNFDRTLMSAQALLLGLYPMGTGPLILPHRFQPIPIHTVSQSNDALVVKFDTKKIEALEEKFVLESSEWKAKEAAMKPHFAHWSEALGVKISSLSDLVSLADTLFIYQLYQIPIHVLNTDEVTQIIQSGYDALVMPYKSKELTHEIAAPLLSLIIEYLQNAAHKKSPLKYVLLSAHDTTILSAMGALGAPLNKMPRYTSILNFSVYETMSGNSFVDITYNDKPVIIPQCGGNRCTIEQLTL